MFVSFKEKSLSPQGNDMLHIIHPQSARKSFINLQEVVDHRIDFYRSNQMTGTGPYGKDTFDTPYTLYVAYQNPTHGIIGSTRILPKMVLPEEVLRILPSNEEISFTLIDCLFHLSPKTGFYRMPEPVVSSQIKTLSEEYYGSLLSYLEKKALQEESPGFYFYLREEEFLRLSRHSRRKLFVMKEISRSVALGNYYVGTIDFSDLFRDSIFREEFLEIS